MKTTLGSLVKCALGSGVNRVEGNVEVVLVQDVHSYQILEVQALHSVF